MKAIVSLAVLAAALALGGSASAEQFITNGDFTELSSGVGQFDYNTTVTGWSGNGGYNFVMSQADLGANGMDGFVALWDSANGGATSWNGQAAVSGNFAALDGDYYTDALTQTVNGLTAGHTYTLSLYYAFAQQAGFTGPTDQSLSGSFGAQLGDTDTFTVISTGFDGWYHASGTVTATSTTEVLSFLAHGDSAPPFALISNVSLTGGVPEPATWTMMILGLGGLGALARRRRAISAAATA